MTTQFSWSKTVLPIAGIFSARMLGLFMLIPVFSVVALTLNHATPALIGIALGSYGLSQGLLQIPFGLLSDKYGRKPLIALGLLFFIIGSLLGAVTHSIYGMIVARILQGMGAIGSVLIALIADLTTEAERSKAMAVIGMMIGLSFGLAMIISPIITSHFGLSGIFYLAVCLAVGGLGLLFFVIPNPVCGVKQDKANSQHLTAVLKNRALYQLDLGIFCQHLILTSTFYAIPLLIKMHMQANALSQQWHFYLPIMLGSFILAVPLIIFSEKKNKTHIAFQGCVALIFIAQLLLLFSEKSFPILAGVLFVYFIAFNFLEALLPSLISKKANKESKGTAMGIYSTCQFLGIFIGGVLAGFLFQWSGFQAIFIMNSLITLGWFFTGYRR